MRALAADVNIFRPQEHADSISAASMGAMMTSSGFGGTFGGLLLSAVGFRSAWRIASVVMLTGPLAFAISLHPRVLRRELAPAAETAKVESRSSQVAGEPTKTRKQREAVHEGASEDETGTTGYYKRR